MEEKGGGGNKYSIYIYPLPSTNHLKTIANLIRLFENDRSYVCWDHVQFLRMPDISSQSLTISRNQLLNIVLLWVFRYMVVKKLIVATYWAKWWSSWFMLEHFM